MGTETPSWHIGGKAAQTHYYARMQAERIGFPLTHAVTINFASTKVAPREAVQAFARLRRHHFNKWATRPGRDSGPACQPTYAFAFENVRNGIPFLSMNPGEPHNVHVHWQLHLPATRVFDFQNRVWDWVEVTTGGITGGAETIMIKPVTEKPTGYLIKGTTGAWAEMYGRGQAAEAQGLIIGRRADVSRNLGPSARRASDRMAGVRRQKPQRRPAQPTATSPMSGSA